MVHPREQEDTDVRPQVSAVHVSPVLEGALAMEGCVVHDAFEDVVSEVHVEAVYRAVPGVILVPTGT